MFNKILVCLDGSPLAEQILPYATAQAECCGGKLVLFQVISTPGAIYAPGIEAVPIAVPLDQVPREEAAAKEYLEGLAEPLRQKGIDAECLTLIGSSGESIVRHAEENDFNLVALATHGRSGLGRLVFGSVADYVIRHSGRPILLIKPKDTPAS
jgi:nucleotide-binding universal stress UspA family protein